MSTTTDAYAHVIAAADQEEHSGDIFLKAEPRLSIKWFKKQSMFMFHRRSAKKQITTAPAKPVPAAAKSIAFTPARSISAPPARDAKTLPIV